MLPIAAAIGICYLFDLKGAESLWVVVPTAAVSMSGIIYVCGVMMIKGPVASYRKRRRNRAQS